MSTVPDNLRDPTPDTGVDENEIDAEARHADMRIQVVMREINQGALAGLGYQSQIGEYAARLVISALDDFDYQALNRAWGDGFRQGMAWQKFRDGGPGQ